jgi:hypothetical protein
MMNVIRVIGEIGEEEEEIAVRVIGVEIVAGMVEVTEEMVEEMVEMGVEMGVEMEVEMEVAISSNMWRV